MMGRKFGADIENLVKEKSSNHIVLKSRSFSFDGKTKAPSHITRRTSFAEQKPVALQLNKTVVQTALIVQKPSQFLLSIQKDIQCVPEFLKDCIKHMRSKEKDTKKSLQKLKGKNPQYLSKRGQIVDWMAGLHFQLKLFPQTLFIAVNYMDEFCSQTPIKQSQLQLLAASCLLISGKFQETYQIPCIRSIQQFFDHPVQRCQIIKMEERVLDNLGFGLIFDTPLKYLQLFSKLGNLSNKNFYIASYILELSLIQPCFIQFSSSVMGSAVSYLVNKIRKISPPWPAQFNELIEYDQAQLKTCAKNLCSLLQRSQSIQNGKNIRSKFSRPEFCSASNIRLQRKNQ